jgi:xylitol oxidase
LKVEARARLSNWAGNLNFSATHWLEPNRVEELQEAVASNPLVKAAGSRHSFSDIADTTGTLISTQALTKIGPIREDAVWVEAGVRYGELADFLRPNGRALANLASLPHISIAGACATGTHGSGIRNQNLSTAVKSMEFVRSDGSLQTSTRGDDDFDASVVHLGALGVVARLEIKLIPTFDIAQTAYDYLPFRELESHFEEVLGAGYSVSLFTRWTGDDIDQVWVKRLSSEPMLDTLFGAKPADAARHPIRGMPADFCTTQLGIVGPWDERLAHFKMEFTPSSGEELQSEYFVPRTVALEALREVRGLAHRIAPHLHISEIRTIAADDLWMSPAYGRDSVGIHFTWKKHPEEVAALLPDIERVLYPFDARPHWAKLFTIGAERIAEVYPRTPDFVDLARACDPTGKFRNAYLDRLILGS